MLFFFCAYQKNIPDRIHTKYANQQCTLIQKLCHKETRYNIKRQQHKQQCMHAEITANLEQHGLYAFPCSLTCVWNGDVHKTIVIDGYIWFFNSWSFIIEIRASATTCQTFQYSLETWNERNRKPRNYRTACRFTHELNKDGYVHVIHWGIYFEHKYKIE